MLVLVFSDLGWGGFTAGANRWYLVDEDSSSFYAQETVLTVNTWDGTGSRCSFSTPVDRADYVVRTFSYDPQVDTGYAYYDGTYLVDFADNWLFDAPGLTGLRVLKFPLIVGDTWQATDTCIYPLNTRIPSGGDEDWDGIVDSVYFSPSYATLLYYSGDTADVVVSPYVFTIVYTNTYPDTGSTFICCRELSAHFYLRIRYVNTLGFVHYSIDTIVFYQRHAIVDTSTTPWDTTYVPPSRIATYSDYVIWTYTTTAVSEAKPCITSIFYRLNGRKLTALEDLTLYSYDGRLVGKVQNGSTVLLRPGVYFVRMRKKTVKVVVR
ncbi:MAG: hypothetical protein GXO39_04905 [Thermotogae bacterium]|nr:hypothetical protein [Thermotogota bacterium]